LAGIDRHAGVDILHLLGATRAAGHNEVAEQRVGKIRASGSGGAAGMFVNLIRAVPSARSV
jgi:hypothetical protein